MFKNFIQIAGVIDLEEALMLVDQRVNYIGFPLRLKDGREELSEKDAKFIIHNIKNKTNPVLITYLDNTKEIIELCNYLGVNIIQLHGKIESQQIQNLRETAPNIQIIKSLIVKENNLKDLCEEIDLYSKLVDIYITDTYDPVTGSIGATGRTHNWGIGRQVVELSSKPVILAGGLNPGNIREAILTVRPAGVDSHTGVEGANGRKDIELVKQFVTEAQKGFNDLLIESQN